MTNRTLRRDALAIFRAALAAANPEGAVTRRLQRLNLARYRDIYVLGAGKAGASMALAAERVLGRRITAGFINVKDGHTVKLRRIELHECGQPVPAQPRRRRALRYRGQSALSGDAEARGPAVRARAQRHHRQQPPSPGGGRAARPRPGVSHADPL